jgi:LuxR family transcriptional regulator, maltose regulon positive regulatory protein
VLVNRLRASSSAVMTVLAPAGYGKTTVLAQWAERDERPFAWVSCAEEEDAAGLLAQVSELANRAGPAVTVVDDLHLLSPKPSGEVIASLAGRVPEGSTVVLAGRSLPRGPIARLRAQGELFELGSEDLAFTRRDVERLLHGLGLELADAELDDLRERLEGWPAGVYLSALALKDGGSRATAPGGDDRFVRDFLDFELLSRLSAKDVRFLTRTAVLDSMCGPLCDAVLETEGSGRKLEALEDAGMFLVPLDRRRWSYRYHREFRSFLRVELERREPSLVATLCRRASAWCEEDGEPHEAIAYAHAAGDVDRVARSIGRHTLAAWADGKRDTVAMWLSWFDETSELERHPLIAVLEAWMHALVGRPSASERCLALAERAVWSEGLPDGSSSIQPWLAVVRALHCAHGIERMRADAELTIRELGPASGWRPAAFLLRGAAEFLLGEHELADAALAEAVEEAESIGVVSSRILALSERSLLAAARGDEAGSEELGLEACGLIETHGREGIVHSALAFALSARREAHRGNLDRARLELERARSLDSRLTWALPWYSVQTALELAQVHLSILDVTAARAWLAAADEILLRRPDLGVLVARRAQLGEHVDRLTAAQEGKASTLTPAELRLLPLLATHLSFREIGEHLFVSRNTVKTQAISVYRKLGVSSRSEAVERAGELGLVGRAAEAAVDFIRVG